MKAPRNKLEEQVLSISSRLMERTATLDDVAQETGWRVEDYMILVPEGIWYCHAEGRRWDIVEAPSKTAAASAYRSRLKLDDLENVRVFPLTISASGWIYPVTGA